MPYLGGMSDSAEQRATDLFPIRIIAVALILGPTIFLGVAFVLRATGSFESGEGLEQRDDILHWALLALAMSAVTVHTLIPNLIRNKQGATLESFRGMTIIRLAACEAAALFGTVCYLLTGRPMGAGVAIAMLGFALLLQFPTAERLDAWLDRND